MFRSRRKSYWSSYGPKRKKPLLPRLGIVLISIPLVLVVLELLLRTVPGLTGTKTAQDAAPNELARLEDYRLAFLTPSGEPYDLPNQGSLRVQHSSLVGYRLVADQQSRFWQINPQGFRAEQAIAAAKPKDEVRIFILGGSTAFGQLSASNQTTFADQLETLLNQQVQEQQRNPGKFRPATLPYYADEVTKVMGLPPRIRESRYQVVNAAVPGYMSGNTLSQLALEILAYQPDFIVLVDGYKDLLLPSTEDGTGIPGSDGSLQQPRYVLAEFSQGVQTWAEQFYLVRSYQSWFQRPQVTPTQFIPPADTQASLSQRLTTDPAELERRSQRYRTNLDQIAQLTTLAKARLIVALQPEISQRSTQKLTPGEKEILSQLGAAYPQEVQTGYQKLQDAIAEVKGEFPKGVVTLNLNQVLAQQSGPIFQDAIHLTDAANTLVAKQLYEVMSQQLTLSSKPFSGWAPPRR